MKQKQTQKLALNRFENEVEVSPKITNLVLLCEQIDKNSINPYSWFFSWASNQKTNLKESWNLILTIATNFSKWGDILRLWKES